MCGATAGKPVMEYVGDVVSRTEAKIRETLYRKTIHVCARTPKPEMTEPKTRKTSDRNGDVALRVETKNRESLYRKTIHVPDKRDKKFGSWNPEPEKVSLCIEPSHSRRTL